MVCMRNQIAANVPVDLTVTYLVSQHQPDPANRDSSAHLVGNEKQTNRIKTWFRSRENGS